ncbi:4-hydroxybenzoate octaprenyltransferase [Chlamydia felis Fe/C-56]|uniref:4-hydroxybenzoate octaprenyltransferase n=1 Tax=Chlamydia felis (strain Fe/C-56) TaxID=264202 RepID=Q254M5_CHLFF|nr:4-hydroxybenzoate octaprenyltransferase [Chlamydia felis]BAE81263.1 4-hydroxybenzoate octaprenyltransferase [Chlamydia felis Fe/C-56]
MKIKHLRQLLNVKHALFSAIFLSATTTLALTFPEISAEFSGNRWSILFIGGFAFLCARTVGILANQIIDLRIDAKNPRTHLRILPGKKLPFHFVLLITILSAFSFMILSMYLNKTCFGLSFISILLMIVYAYAKRVTYLCHWMLGLVYYLAILMNFYALSAGYLSLKMFSIASLWGLTAAMIIAANDIIYAIQDLDFDKQEKLYSIPACFGEEKAIRIASACLIMSLLSYMAVILLASFTKWGIMLSIFPVLVIGKTIKNYHKIGEGNDKLEKCFFRGNVYLALSFFVVMVGLFIL